MKLKLMVAEGVSVSDADKEQAQQILKYAGMAAEERLRQNHKWGVQSHPNVSPATTNMADWNLTYQAEADTARVVNEENSEDGNTNWKDILDEEILEAYAEAYSGDEAALQTELIQAAAVCLAWAQDIGRRLAQSGRQDAEPASTTEE